MKSLETDDDDDDDLDDYGDYTSGSPIVPEDSAKYDNYYGTGDTLEQMDRTKRE